MLIFSRRQKSIKNFPACKELNSKLHYSMFVWFDSLRPSQQFFSYVRIDFPLLNQYWARINGSCSRTQHSGAGEAWTRNPSVLSQAFYHWATVLHYSLWLSTLNTKEHRVNVLKFWTLFSFFSQTRQIRQIYIPRRRVIWEKHVNHKK